MVLTSEQIRQWDAFTIEHTQIAFIDLMERAVIKCLEWLEKNNYLTRTFTIYCGKGNNGGDGLALARLLWDRQCAVKVFILEFGHKGTEDFQANLERLHQTEVEIFFIQSEDHLHPIPADTVVVDALFGSGLNRALERVSTRLIEHINLSGNEIIAIDIPSGMFADKSSKNGVVIKAAHTLSFQCYKLAFLLAENEPYFGNIHILDIGLAPEFLSTLQSELEIIDERFIKAIYHPRKSFAHKGTYGHALIVAGSYGKMGAAQLAARACLRTGVGLLTCIVPACGYSIMQTAVPEAMTITDAHAQFITGIETDVSRYDAVGIGPGLGTEQLTAKAMESFITTCKKPVVVDADGLNILAANKNMLSKLPPFSILTPHPKEFERLFGAAENDFERIDLARTKSRELQVIILLKGHHSFVAMPGGKGYFNNTGNAGMATGGSGDVLTGIITSLLAQGYTPQEASLLGVYLHGLAGDFAAAHQSQEALIASDIIDCLGEGFKQIAQLG